MSDRRQYHVVLLPEAEGELVRDSGEGPFGTWDEAERFARAEVGAPWAIVPGRYLDFSDEQVGAISCAVVQAIEKLAAVKETCSIASVEDVDSVEDQMRVLQSVLETIAGRQRS